MEDASPAETLLRLLDACLESEKGAGDLARQADSRELRALLQECARELRSAADDLRAALSDIADASQTPAPLHSTVVAPHGDVAAAWERAECETLACFRDAFDSNLPAPLVKTVRRHYEAGIARLETLRALQAHQH